MELHDRVKAFVERTLTAMGVPLEISISQSPHITR